MTIQERPLPVPVARWFHEIEAKEIPLVPRVFGKIRLDLQRDQASLGEAPNYFSGIVMEGNGRYYRLNRSYSVGRGVYGESLTIFVDLDRTEKDGLTTYFPHDVGEEITGFHTEIYFLLPKDRPFGSSNKNLINWARWFLEASGKTIMAWGKLRLNYGASISETFLHLLGQEQLVSLKDFLGGYLVASEVNPVFKKDLRKDVARDNSPEAKKFLQAIEVLDKLYALAISAG